LYRLVDGTAFIGNDWEKFPVPVPECRYASAGDRAIPRRADGEQSVVWKERLAVGGDPLGLRSSK